MIRETQQEWVPGVESKYGSLSPSHKNSSAKHAVCPLNLLDCGGLISNHAELCRVLFFSGRCEFGGFLKDVSLNTASPHLQYHVLDLGLGGSGSMSTSTMFSRHVAALTSLSVYRWEVRFSDSSRGHRSVQEYYP